MDGPLPTPDDLIDEKKKERRTEREQLRKDVQEAKNRISGNPAVVDALEALEERVERLEDRAD